MKKCKLIIISSLTLSLAVFSFQYLKNSDKSLTINSMLKTSLKTELKDPKKMKSADTIDRKMASTPSKKMTDPVIGKRVYIGNNIDLDSIHYSNKISKDWKEKYRHHFLRMIPDHKVQDFKVDLKRSIVLIKGNIGTYFEHVVVSYTNPDGRPFSFEAHINSQTGMLAQTWNKTHHEMRKPLQINGNKYAYKKEK